jgi:N-acetylgalactosamine-N,N'-diacetylbacillosaminyl-diphospho-undecaprenol 4-alpha-N-acetylgalactosaminyltransferase
MKKNIAIFAYSLGSGGAERQISYLLNHLYKQYNFTLVLMNNTIFYKIPNDIKIIYLENSDPYEHGIKKLLKLPILAWKYRQLLIKNNIDLSLSFMTRPNYINILSKYFMNDTRTIISERSMFSLHYDYNNLQSFINKRLVRLYNSADLIITNAINNGNDLKNNFNIHADIKTIYNAVDSKSIEKLKNISLETQISSDTFNFITIGRLDQGKNHQLLINCMVNINANLYIIGEGILKDNLEEQIISLGLENKVFLLGRLNNPYNYLYQSDCFVFSSNHEGMPNVLLESLACHLPIITTDCQSGPREILAPQTSLTKVLSDEIELAEYGILTPIKSKLLMSKAMQVMVENNEIRNEYKLKSKHRAAFFNIENMIEKFVEIIDKNIINEGIPK